MPDNAGVAGSFTDKPINALGFESDSGDSINAGGHGLSKSSSASSLSGTAPEMPVLEGWPSSPSSSETDPEMPHLGPASPSPSGRDPEMPDLAWEESEEESQVGHEMPQPIELLGNLYRRPLLQPHEDLMMLRHWRSLRPLLGRVETFSQSAAIGAAWVGAAAWMTVGSPLPQR